jgi:hypothetical protein
MHYVLYVVGGLRRGEGVGALHSGRRCRFEILFSADTQPPLDEAQWRRPQYAITRRYVLYTVLLHCLR